MTDWREELESHQSNIREAVCQMGIWGSNVSENDLDERAECLVDEMLINFPILNREWLWEEIRFN